jgi:hypothetical protein
MGYWGTSVPAIVTLDGSGAAIKTFTLTKPPKGGRLFQWKIEANPAICPLTGELLPRRSGYRAYFKLRYEGSIDSEFEDLLDIANSQNELLVLPYGTGGVSFVGLVTGFDSGQLDYVSMDYVEIEIQGKSRKQSIPNLDTLYTTAFRKIIVA